MICGYIAKSKKQYQGLVINRSAQKELKKELSYSMGYSPFIYNTNYGLYFFLEKSNCKNHFEIFLEKKLKLYAEIPHQLYRCYKDNNFFYNEVVFVLTDEKSSPLAWKNFISSFLGQLDPFNGDTKSVHSLFKLFVNIIKEVGDDTQLIYLKQKMNNLRARVNINDFLET